MNISAQPEGLPETAQQASLPSRLASLYFRPSRLFADLTPLEAKPMWIIVAWICGVVSAIDRAEMIMVKSDLTGRQGSAMPLDSWVAFWPFILIVGLRKKRGARCCSSSSFGSALQVTRPCALRLR